MANRRPLTRTIKISVDNQNNFSYTDLFDSSTSLKELKVINGDRIAWVLDPSIPERHLQIDFELINPFQIFTPKTLRGKDHVVSDKVNFPKGFPGDRQLKYSVSLGNGLHDDPDIVPVESDSSDQHSAALQVDDFKIEWTDTQNHSAIKLDPTEVSKAAGGSGVTWGWHVGSGDPTPPFDLDFNSPIPPGWPTTTTHSKPGNTAITLVLPAGLATKTKFRITTFNGSGTDRIWADGYLKLT